MHLGEVLDQKPDYHLEWPCAGTIWGILMRNKFMLLKGHSHEFCLLVCVLLSFWFHGPKIKACYEQEVHSLSYLSTENWTPTLCQAANVRKDPLLAVEPHRVYSCLVSRSLVAHEGYSFCQLHTRAIATSRYQYTRIPASTVTKECSVRIAASSNGSSR